MSVTPSDVKKIVNEPSTLADSGYPRKKTRPNKEDSKDFFINLCKENDEFTIKNVIRDQAKLKNAAQLLSRDELSNFIKTAFKLIKAEERFKFLTFLKFAPKAIASCLNPKTQMDEIIAIGKLLYDNGNKPNILNYNAFIDGFSPTGHKKLVELALSKETKTELPTFEFSTSATKKVNYSGTDSFNPVANEKVEKLTQIEVDIASMLSNLAKKSA